MPFQPLLPFGSDAAEPAHSRLVDELARVCREKSLEEKVFIAPSLAIGHQFVEAVARGRTPWAHLRVETVRHLAHSVVGPSLAHEGLMLLSRAQALALVEQACKEALGPDSYFGRIADRPGLHRALQSTLDELRGAGLSAATFPVRAFHDSRKAAELASILSRYEELLASGQFLDRPGILRRALQTVRAADRESGPWYLVPSRLELSSAERELVEKVAGPRWITLPSELLESWRDVARSAHLFRAIGEENEVREVFRRFLSGPTATDDVELLYTDPKTYPALIYELSCQYAVPCTFAGGIAVTFSRPGQAAIGFLAWIGGGFEESELRSMVSAGAVDIPATHSPSEPVPSIEAARVLRAAAIGWGRSRHLTGLDRLIRELGKPDAAGRRASEEDPDAVGKDARRARTLACAQAVRRFLESVLRGIPPTDSGQVELPALA
ncbi:MAG TPA: hypothetical protein VIZ69_06755, partial [Thermoanaerobaculia bacterium]